MLVYIFFPAAFSSAFAQNPFFLFKTKIKERFLDLERMSERRWAWNS
jgi:hypothetical protein